MVDVGLGLLDFETMTMTATLGGDRQIRPPKTEKWHTKLLHISTPNRLFRTETATPAGFQKEIKASRKTGKPKQTSPKPTPTTNDPCPTDPNPNRWLAQTRPSGCTCLGRPPPGDAPGPPPNCGRPRDRAISTGAPIGAGVFSAWIPFKPTYRASRCEGLPGFTSEKAYLCRRLCNLCGPTWQMGANVPWGPTLVDSIYTEI